MTVELRVLKSCCKGPGCHETQVVLMIIFKIISTSSRPADMLKTELILNFLFILLYFVNEINQMQS